MSIHKVTSARPGVKISRGPQVQGPYRALGGRAPRLPGLGARLAPRHDDGLMVTVVSFL